METETSQNALTWNECLQRNVFSSYVLTRRTQGTN